MWKMSSPRWAGRINDAVTDGPKADAAIAQLFDQLGEHGASPPIEPPHDERVALLQFRKASAQARASDFDPEAFTEDVVLVDAQADQRVHLKREVLVVSANARIADQTTAERGLGHGTFCR